MRPAQSKASKHALQPSPNAVKCFALFLLLFCSIEQNNGASMQPMTLTSGVAAATTNIGIIDPLTSSYSRPLSFIRRKRDGRRMHRFSPFSSSYLMTKQLSTRGGGEKNEEAVTSTIMTNEERASLRKYKEIAKDRHTDACRAAMDAYWSKTAEQQKSGTTTSTEDQSWLENVEFDSYGIHPSCTWDVPDFQNEFDLGKVIHVTKGAAGTTNSNTTEDEAEQTSTPFFSSEECHHVISLSESHFSDSSSNDDTWTTLKSGRFDVCGFWIKDVPMVHAWFNSMLKERLFPSLQTLFPKFVSDISDLVVDSAYLFKYTPETGGQTDVHTDSGCLSFTIALNSKDDYTGGGTWFDSLSNQNGDAVNGQVVEMDMGHITFRPGGVRHQGNAITSGTRYIIGGFVMHKRKVEYVRMLTGLGIELAAQGKLLEAEEALKAAICLNPNFDSAYSSLADVQKKLNKESDALHTLQRAIKINPNSGEILYSLGLLLRNAAQSSDAAKACFLKCVQIDPRDTDAMIELAELCAADGDSMGETKWHTTILQTPHLKPKTAATAYCNLGVIFGDGGSIDEEIIMYQKALSLVPHHFQARYSLASAYANRRELALAVTEYRKAIDVAREEENAVDEKDALQACYSAAVIKINEDDVAVGAGNVSRESIMARLFELLGEDNYKRLVAFQ